jgi:hypothetical protein
MVVELGAEFVRRCSDDGEASAAYGLKVCETLRRMDSNFQYRSAKAADFRSIPGIARVSAGLLNDTT